MKSLRIKRIDVIAVYPSSKRTYFGKKWAIVSYELAYEIKGIIDFPIPKECDDIHPIAAAAIMQAVRRGAYESIVGTNYVPVAA